MSGSGRVRRLAMVADRIGYEERAIVEAAKRHGLEPIWVNDSQLCMGPRASTVPDADVYLLRSRSYTRATVIAGLLDDRGARTVNSVRAIELCNSKLATLRALDAAGLLTVDFRVILSRDDLDAAIETFDIPLVLKPLFGGFGRRVLLIRDPDLAHSVYDFVEHHAQSFDRVLLAQPFHQGADVRAVVVGGLLVAAGERIPLDDWRANVAADAVSVPAVISGDLRGLGRRVAHVTGADVLAFDAFREDDGFVLSEVNCAPRFRGLAAATGVDIADAIARYVGGCDAVRAPSESQLLGELRA